MTEEDTTNAPPCDVWHSPGCSLRFQTPISSQIPVFHRLISFFWAPLGQASHLLPKKHQYNQNTSREVTLNKSILRQLMLSPGLITSSCSWKVNVFKSSLRTQNEGIQGTRGLEGPRAHNLAVSSCDASEMSNKISMEYWIPTSHIIINTLMVFLEWDLQYMYLYYTLNMNIMIHIRFF